MPSRTNKQRRFIFAKRGKYKSSKNTPDNWKWIWNDDWTHVSDSLSHLISFKLYENHLSNIEKHIGNRISNLIYDAAGNTYNVVYKGDEIIYELGFGYFAISTRGKDQQSFYLYNRNVIADGKLPMIFRDAKLDSNGEWVGNETSIRATIKSKPWLNLNYYDLYGILMKLHKSYDSKF